LNASIANGTAANLAQTPSHRTQLGPAAQSSMRLGSAANRNLPNILNRNSQSQTPGHRQSFPGITVNSAVRPSVSGYGMSAGMKVGRQQGESALRSSTLIAM